MLKNKILKYWFTNSLQLSFQTKGIICLVLVFKVELMRPNPEAGIKPYTFCLMASILTTRKPEKKNCS